MGSALSLATWSIPAIAIPDGLHFFFFPQSIADKFVGVAPTPALVYLLRLMGAFQLLYGSVRLLSFPDVLLALISSTGRSFCLLWWHRAWETPSSRGGPCIEYSFLLDTIYFDPGRIKAEWCFYLHCGGTSHFSRTTNRISWTRSSNSLNVSLSLFLNAVSEVWQRPVKTLLYLAGCFATYLGAYAFFGPASQQFSWLVVFVYALVSLLISVSSVVTVRLRIAVWSGWGSSASYVFIRMIHVCDRRWICIVLHSLQITIIFFFE